MNMTPIRPHIFVEVRSLTISFNAFIVWATRELAESNRLS